MGGPADAPLRIAVLVNGERVKRWKRDALAPLAETDGVEVTHVVVNERRSDVDRWRTWTAFVRRALVQVRTYPLWSLVGVARVLTSTPGHDRLVPIDAIDEVADAERVLCAPRRVDDHWETLPEPAIERIEHVDVVVRFGFGMLTGRILSAPTYGVLSYHPGDVRAYRGRPGGLWEFLHGEDEVGVTVQRLNDTLDGGAVAVLVTVDADDANTWQAYRRRAFQAAEGLLVPAVLRLVDPDESLRRPDPLGELYTLPRGWAVVRYVVMNTRGRLRDTRGRVRDATAGVPRTPAAVSGRLGAKPGTTALTFVLGVLLVLAHPLFMAHPLFTHHYIVPIHVEQFVGVVLAAVAVVLFATYDRRQVA